ncbi:XdhC/CoxI family protein [Streptomyces sp. NPDC004237]|uniref:XdhC family protein n=1 Tax=Streptomyces sp. NPDC004237 TaxID=3154455 RepID=UPI0033B4EBFE
MLDLAAELSSWVEQSRDFAVATVVRVGRSAPRPPGAALAVDSEGTAIGSVSGGCVEGAIYDACVQSLRDGQTVLERFGYSDNDPFAVGLTCGGTIEVLVTPVRTDTPDGKVLASALSYTTRKEGMALTRVIQGPEDLLGRLMFVHTDGSHEGGLGHSAELDRTAAAETRAMLEAGRTGTVELSASGRESHCLDGLTLFVETYVPPPRMIVFGAIDFAAALVRVGKFLGYHVTVCDARSTFATRARFPEADDIVIDWPHRYLRQTTTDERTVLCVLTHDAKFDVPLLQEALRLPVGYIGAMGSRRTQAERDRQLREVGVSEQELARLRSPIGLDLGARTPAETAISIAAEIIATRHGGTGVPLTDSRTPIHRYGPDRAGAVD